LLAQQQHHQEYSGFMADDEQQSFSDKQCPSAIVKHALLSPRKSSFVLTRRRLTYKQQKLDISESEMVAAKLRQGITGCCTVEEKAAQEGVRSGDDGKCPWSTQKCPS
jgi:hypothetical protein